MDFDRKRKIMVETQLIPRGIKNQRVLDAMGKVPRHEFVGERNLGEAYSDMALPIGKGQTISQPYMVAVMTALLDLKGDERVLELGTGSGYQAAILAELTKEVYTIERIEALTEIAEKKFQKLGYKNIYTRVSDGTTGWSEKAPFNRVIITAGAPKIPDVLLDQIPEGGIILAPIGDRFFQQLIRLQRVDHDRFNREFYDACVFVPLIGKYGWGD